ncbi:hypothetical protein Trydic_g2336 [Trypoxylus dichotomus]
MFGGRGWPTKAFEDCGEKRQRTKILEMRTSHTQALINAAFSSQSADHDEFSRANHAIGVICSIITLSDNIMQTLESPWELTCYHLEPADVAYNLIGVQERGYTRRCKQIAKKLKRGHSASVHNIVLDSES